MSRATPVSLSLLALVAIQWLAGASDAAAEHRADVSSRWARTANDDDLAIKLVTFGPGDAIHQYFGHNALIVEDTRRRVSSMYNFGMFGFGADMLPKYLQGQLEFWVAATPVAPTFEHYAAINRSIRIVELDLPPTARRKLAERLAWWALPANRNYRYHHYRDNCSTKLRDLLDSATSGQLRAQQSKPARLNYRGHTWRYTQHDAAVHFLLILWMNDSMEWPIKAWHEAFLPDELEREVLQAQLAGPDGVQRPLARSHYTVFEARREQVPLDPGSRWAGVLAVGVLLGGMATLLGRWAADAGRLSLALFGLHHVVVGVVVGIPGLVLFLFLFTEWTVTHWNENLWIVGPLTFAALPLGCAMLFGSRRALRWMTRAWQIMAAASVVALLLELLPSFDQNNGLPLALLVPINLGFALGATLATRKAPRPS